MRMSTIVGAVVLLVTGFAAAPLAEQSSDGRLTVAQMEQWIKQYSNWGRWGKDDQLGTLNLITPAKRKQAAELVKDGSSISLAEEQVPNVAEPGRPAPYQLTMKFPEGYEKRVTTEPWTAPPAEQLLVPAHGSRTHLDALAHNFYKGQYYNGLSYNEITEKGAAKGGIQNLKNGVVTRAILMDIPRLKGVPYLELGAHIYPQDLEAWEKKAGVKVSAGDAVLIRTGWWARLKAVGNPGQGSAGLDPSCIPWFRQRDVAIVGSEAVLDAQPSGYTGKDLPTHPVHYFVLVFLGMNIFDHLDLDAVSEAAAARNRWEFLLMAAPLPVRGGTGSPINPIAVF